MSEGVAETEGSSAAVSGGGPGVRPAGAGRITASLVPERGWHFLHLYFQVDRNEAARMSREDRDRGGRDLIAALDASSAGSADTQSGSGDTQSGSAGFPEQFQCFLVPGHKADFGVLMASPNVHSLMGVQRRIQSCGLAPALKLAYSFYSMTEISEYVPDVEEYARILRDRERLDPASPAYDAKVKAYEARLEPMNRQRLYPEFPDWPCVCFYPMSKTRLAGQNWFMLSQRERAELMHEHGKSGMKFAGRVTQVITASTGLDDWEWGVTLWGKNPSYIKDIVYTMRFDEASAKYALFGPFYMGYIAPAAEVVKGLSL